MPGGKYRVCVIYVVLLFVNCVIENVVLRQLLCQKVFYYSCPIVNWELKESRGKHGDSNT